MSERELLEQIRDLACDGFEIHDASHDKAIKLLKQIAGLADKHLSALQQPSPSHEPVLTKRRVDNLLAEYGLEWIQEGIAHRLGVKDEAIVHRAIIEPLKMLTPHAEPVADTNSLLTDEEILEATEPLIKAGMDTLKVYRNLIFAQNAKDRQHRDRHVLEVVAIEFEKVLNKGTIPLPEVFIERVRQHLANGEKL